MPVTSPMKLFSDSKSAISVVANPVQHVRIDRSFIKTEADNGTIVLSYIPTKSPEAGILKMLFRNQALISVLAS